MAMVEEGVEDVLLVVADARRCLVHLVVSTTTLDDRRIEFLKETVEGCQEMVARHGGDPMQGPI